MMFWVDNIVAQKNEACDIGDFDLISKIGHNVRAQMVGTDSLEITADWTKGEARAASFIQSFTDEFYYAGRYARFVIPGGSKDVVQDLSPNSSVLRYVSAGTSRGIFVSDWFVVDEYNYSLEPGRPDVVRFTLRLTRVRL